MSGDPRGDRESEARSQEREEETTVFLPSDEEATRIAPPAPDAYGLTGSSVAQYEVGERLGKGGMGVVYKALDTRLHRTVALKFLRLSMSEEAEARDRFFAEARSASALDHTNICTVHEVGETEDRGIFIVMGYYQGQTLGEKIAGRALPVETALDYGQQIASGLAAAHGKGILHRDLKPANVMVTQPAAGAEQGVLKILDFGLAKMEGIELTRTGTTMGTLAYMSPEQARGERVDPRTDVWSLGVILYEMLTGRRPFHVTSELAMLQALANDEITAPSEIEPEVPAELDRIVLKCLSKDKEGRYTDAQALLADLRGLYMATVSQTLSGRDLTLQRPEPPARRWKSPMGVAAVALVLIALVLVLPATRRLLFGPAAGSAAGPRLVAVLPFVNSLGPAEENQALTDGLTHSMTSLAARLGTDDDALWIVPGTEVVQRGITTAGDALKFFGVNTVLTGSVQRIGESIEIILNVVDPTTQPPRTLDSRVLTAPVSPELREKAMVELAGLLNLDLSAEPGRAELAEQAISAPAYTLYLQGLGFLQRPDRSGNVDRAILAFNEVLKLEPAYGPAFSGLCEARWETYRLSNDPEVATEAMGHCERAAELSAGQASVLVSVGRSYFEMGEWRKARSQLERALEIEPDNAEAHRWLGWVSFDDGRPEEAVEAFQKAVAAEPGLWVYANDFGELLLALGRNEEAIEQLEKALGLTPENYVAASMLGVAHTYGGDRAEAERLFQRSLDLEPNSLAYRNLGYQRFLESRYDEAVAALESAQELIGESPNFNDWFVSVWLGHAYYWAGDRNAAEETFRHLVEVATSRYEVNPREGNVLVFLSDAHAALGELDQSRFYLSRLLAVPIGFNYLYFYIGRTYEMLGDRELALDYIERALEARFDPWAVDNDPWLEDLRNEPEYKTLRQQFMASGA